MPREPDRRHELGVFLRSRRERITPEEVGLPQTGRRRTPGLRREELALLTGISATWYTYLEQGRDIRASDQVLDALASVLKLDRHERGHLFRLAGHAPPADVEEPTPLSAEAAAVPHLLTSHPAYIISGHYDVLSCNRAAEELFPDLTAATNRPANFARWVFLEPSAREVLVDWEPEARGLLARLRTLAGRHLGDPRYTRLIDELNAGSPEVRAWWPRYDIQARHSGRKRLRRPGRGVVDYAYTAFHLAEQPDQTLVIYIDDHKPATASPPPT
ncbi:transcriptional regulator with XRE-family HTH domain [Streptomyces griseochromogenes]|uniref:Transcriptional regulator n=1 Tax=Streptomyces griseochromogenes TaxID=68214 RepID=A0A1B1B2F1_9ACTN|nr:helix-turn-helix transcriptional regulator [Streptomyces griseochromogenes]ANP52999.1 transcriptional regulator [Streptomyces griseochromogenes]MBP2047660.1 transcriptional regulator with XRE-family HTH domain [Streptomyces griseochromogenes]